MGYLTGRVYEIQISDFCILVYFFVFRSHDTLYQFIDWLII